MEFLLVILSSWITPDLFESYLYSDFFNYIPISMKYCWKWPCLSCSAKRNAEDRSLICQFSFLYTVHFPVSCILPFLKGYTPEGIYKHSICLIPQLLVGLLHRNLPFWRLCKQLCGGERLLSSRSYCMSDKSLVKVNANVFLHFL